MIEKKDISKFAQHIFARTKEHPDKQVMHPQREWLCIIASFVVIFSIGLYLGVTQYQHYQGLADTIQPVTENNIPTYQSSLVEEVHERYRSRETLFAEFIAQTPTQVPVETDQATSSPDLPAELEPADDEDLGQEQLEDETSVSDGE